MKTNFTLFTAILFLLLSVSCKSDDDAADPEPTTADLIVGTWNMNSNTVDDGRATVTVQNIPITADFIWEGKDYDYQLTFKEDNTVDENGGFTVVLTYSAFGQSKTLEMPVQTGAGSELLLSGEYKVSDDQLTVTNEGETVTASIEELTETTLRLSIDLAKVSPAIIDETVENATGTNKISFTRQ